MRCSAPNSRSLLLWGQLALAAAVALHAGEAASDRDLIILDNAQRFRGTVVSEQSDAEWVTVDTGSGRLRLPRARIARVEYGLAARVAQVAPGDLQGLIDLAHWCRAHGHHEQARAALNRAVAFPDCPLAVRGLHARVVDELEGPEVALPLYIAYRNAGGEDPELLARLAELEAARAAWAEQLRGLGLDPEATLREGRPVAAASATPVDEGYERFPWVADHPQWSAPARIETITLLTPEGPRRVLQVDVEPQPDKPALDKAALVLRRPLQLTGRRAFGLLVANASDREIRIALALKTGAQWTYHESRALPVPPGGAAQEFVPLSFDLTAADFKTQASGWAHRARVADLHQVREVQIVIYHGRRSLRLWLAGIGLHGSSE